MATRYDIDLKHWNKGNTECIACGLAKRPSHEDLINLIKDWSMPWNENDKSADDWDADDWADYEYKLADTELILRERDDTGDTKEVCRVRGWELS